MVAVAEVYDLFLQELSTYVAKRRVPRPVHTFVKVRASSVIRFGWPFGPGSWITHCLVPVGTKKVDILSLRT